MPPRSLYRDAGQKHECITDSMNTGCLLDCDFRRAYCRGAPRRPQCLACFSLFHALLPLMHFQTAGTGKMDCDRRTASLYEVDDLS